MNLNIWLFWNCGLNWQDYCFLVSWKENFEWNQVYLKCTNFKFKLAFKHIKCARVVYCNTDWKVKFYPEGKSRYVEQMLECSGWKVIVDGRTGSLCSKKSDFNPCRMVNAILLLDLSYVILISSYWLVPEFFIEHFLRNDSPWWLKNHQNRPNSHTPI